MWLGDSNMTLETHMFGNCLNHVCTDKAQAFSDCWIRVEVMLADCLYVLVLSVCVNCAFMTSVRMRKRGMVFLVVVNDSAHHRLGNTQTFGNLVICVLLLPQHQNGAMIKSRNS